MELPELLEALDVLEDALLIPPMKAIESTRAVHLLEELAAYPDEGAFSVRLKLGSMERIIKTNQSMSTAAAKIFDRSADDLEQTPVDDMADDLIKFTLADNLRDLSQEFGDQASQELRQVIAFKALKDSILVLLPKTEDGNRDIGRKFGLGES